MALTKLTTNLISGNIVTSVNGASGAVTVSTGTDWVTAIQTANFTSVASKGYFVNTTSAEVTITLPVGTVGDEIVIQDYAGTFATNKIILAANGSEKIQGVTGDFKCVTNNATVTLIYQDATKGWTADNIEVNIIPLTVSYLIIGGGGGGGATASWSGGGGGGGGLKTNFSITTLSLTVGTDYPTQVGAGGSIATSSQGTNGSNSVFESITSLGGGGGGGSGSPSASLSNGSNGANGGGALGNSSGVVGGTGSAGFDGGIGGDGISLYTSGGGGGGAGAVGQNATDGGSYVGGNGGAGISYTSATSITGLALEVAGGGGGGANNLLGSAGGVGTQGGGLGSVGDPSQSGRRLATSGTQNTGGGGGGGFASAGQQGKGGSGIVILRYPSDYTISPTSGSGGFTYTTDTSISLTKVTTFTAAGGGNIQFN